MGGGQSIVKVQNGVPSPTLPGTMCVLSESLDEHITYDAFFDSVVCGLKSDFKKSPNFKDGGVKEIGEGHFMVFQVSTFKEIQQDIMAVVVYRVNKEEGSIYEEGRVPVLDLLAYSGCTRVLRDPLRVEYSRQTFVHEDPMMRRSGPVVAGDLKKMMAKVIENDINFMTEQPAVFSPPGSKSVISESLEDFTDIDALYDGLLEALKTQSYNTGLKGEVTVKAETSEDENEEVFLLFFDQDGNNIRIPGAYNVGETAATRIFVKANRFHHVFILQTSLQNYLLSDLLHINCVPDPLRLEAWRMIPTPPYADEQLRALFDIAITMSIKRGKQEDE